MSHHFKPGDVAMIRVGTGEWEYGLLGANGEWICQHAESRESWERVEVRPIVVIDPDDREQVERLVTLWAEAFEDVPPVQIEVDFMQAALREFADPKPRIEEPTGLGAVVELTRGDFLVRVPGTVDDKANWADMHGDFHEWSDLDVAEVHHDGWAGR